MVLIAEVVVDLGHTVVAVSGGSNWTKEVVDICRESIDQRWPKNGRGVGCRIAKQRLRKRTRRNSVGGQQSQSLGLPGKRRFGSQSGQTNYVILFLEGSEKECPILENWTADTESVVLIAQCGRSRNSRARLKER